MFMGPTRHLRVKIPDAIIQLLQIEFEFMTVEKYYVKVEIISNEL